MPATPEERARYARRRYDIANQWWQTSPLGAAAQAGRGGRAAEMEHRQRARVQPTPTAPVARAPVRPAARMAPNIVQGGRRSMVLPTRNLLQRSPTMYYRGGQYVPGGFSGTAGYWPFSVGSGTISPEAMRSQAFNNWRGVRDRAGRLV